ncbi:MAG: 50S ribosomal protein L11 methyltransferase [Gammaproteobacteria bacterium]|nr:50S ribosomal protein L11 methyltransferase [Gammaproteobacteria bacterium]
MSWLQLKFQAPSALAEELADRLTEAGALAVTLRDSKDDPLYEPAPGDTPLWAHTSVEGLFAADADIPSVVEQLHAQSGDESVRDYTVEPLADQAWERVCLDQFKPLCFGDTLCICPTWLTPPDDARVTLLLDPGLAFGTGTHPTTALCLEWLARNPPAGLTVIDYGCGSGILALAAAKLGARMVYATDHDPQALTATRANAEKNELQLLIHTMTPEQLPALEVDVLLANIIAQPLIALAPVFAQHVRAGGRIVLSGILEHQAEEVIAAYRPWFAMVEKVQRDDWMLLEATRTSAMV